MRNREVGGRRRKGEKKRNIEVRERGEGENLLIVNVQGHINSWSVQIVSEHVAATPLTMITMTAKPQ